jgi:DNA (cytosine-5)-methyltransferase 1
VYNVLDLFCGAGGLSLGFKMGHFNIIGGIDYNKDAINTHHYNFPDSFSFCGDIKNFTNEEIHKRFGNSVDVIIGGPPCQGFSLANKQQTDEMKDDRNKLFFQFIRFVEELKPKAFVIENVQGILTKDNGYAKSRIYEILSEANYNVNSQILVASDYGVPQLRKRAFFVGIRKDLNETFDFAKLKLKNKVTVEEAISDLYNYDDSINKLYQNNMDVEYIEKPTSEYQKLMRKNSSHVLNNEIHFPNKKVIARMEHVKQGENWKKVPDHLWDTIRTNRHSSAYKRLKANDLSVTIDTGHMNYFHPLENRVPTVRESARLQSFPDDFKFLGNKGAQFTQVGNAVPPLLAKTIADEIMILLSKNDFEKKTVTMKTIDLFCGAGGFSKGFEMAGFDTVFAIDKWPQAIKTFNYNRIEDVAISSDINEFTDSQIEDLRLQGIDGIIGGPPCQGYSMVGTRKAGDERNNLYLQYVRFVKKIMPKFFILENVKGLLTLEGGFFKKDIVERFYEVGYNVNQKVLKASEYGVPQNRERVFFVGLRQDIFGDKYFNFPTPNKDSFISNEEALSDFPSLDNHEDPTQYGQEPMNDFQKLMRKNSQSLENNILTVHTPKTISIISKVPDGCSIKDVSDELYKVRNYNAAFKRMNSKLPSSTIDCGHRNYFHYKENRIPTVRESARIQSFPDDYFFTGNKTAQYTQVGNAVPPLLGRAIALEMKKIIQNIN